jgi:hypothetical protein
VWKQASRGQEACHSGAVFEGLATIFHAILLKNF